MAASVMLNQRIGTKRRSNFHLKRFLRFKISRWYNEVHKREREILLLLTAISIFSIKSICVCSSNIDIWAEDLTVWNVFAGAYYLQRGIFVRGCHFAILRCSKEKRRKVFRVAEVLSVCYKFWGDRRFPLYFTLRLRGCTRILISQPWLDWRPRLLGWRKLAYRLSLVGAWSCAAITYRSATFLINCGGSILSGSLAVLQSQTLKSFGPKVVSMVVLVGKFPIRSSRRWGRPTGPGYTTSITSTSQVHHGQDASNQVIIP